ncbi:E3 ubiquitin-protein ligase TRIM71-like [Acanthaster planci]|uniref:E3 ubiquitin-protein ligase TRIM71-like n=1 Tax=Acanthaster planci TaxID=133434 RepID=A0A8B7YXX9_ACAPL|nr:E3 ubiquitin-protein ligase TRIM71-like [Acanthaster planci]
MAEAATKTVRGKISQGYLECPICCCRFISPKILNCLHSFCLRCLDELINSQQAKTDEITCPVCRRVTTVPDNGSQGLTNNFVLSSLVDEFNKQELLLGGTSAAIPMCGECEEGLEAIARCKDCDENYCGECLEAHKRSKRTKKHRIITVDDLMNKKEIKFRDTESDVTVPKCAIHRKYELCFYCSSCEMAICARCAAIDHRSVDHNYSDIADAVSLFREAVEKGLTNVEKHKAEFKATEKSLENSRDRLDIIVTRACQDVSWKEKNEVDKIRHKSRLLREKLIEVAQDRNQQLQEKIRSNREKINTTEQVIASTNSLMQQADDFELLELKTKVMQNLEYREPRAEVVEQDLSFIGVRCHDIVADTDLGDILLEEKWKLKKQIEGGFALATDVACTSDERIAVTDLENKSVTLLTSAGLQIRTSSVQVGEGLQKPFGVTVACGDDLLWVTDTQQVKVLDTNLRMINQFTPLLALDGRLESRLTGICVDKKNRVAVIDRRRKVISVHTLDGSSITTISNNMVDAFLTINKEKIIFANNEKSKLVCVDFSGNEVFCTDIKSDSGGQMHPCGVCCDDGGDIYVSTQNNDVASSEVHRFGPDGIHKGCVARGLDNPFGMVFTSSGDLAVADVSSVKIFQRV